MSEIVLAPRVQFVTNFLNDRYSQLGKGGSYANHDHSGVGENHAVDFWTTNKDVHDAVLHYVIDNARNLGVLYIISWDRIWNIERASEGIRHYERDADHDGTLEASERHTNHVHISFDPRRDNMAFEVKLSDASVKDVANEVEKRLGKVWSAPDTWTPPPGEATEANPTWTPGGFLRYIANKVSKT
jgi:hypothetical protein